MADTDDEELLVTHVLTEEEMLIEGLNTSFSEKKQERCSESTNQKRFNSRFGASPAVICTIYEDLQKSTAQDTSVNPPRSMRMQGSHANLIWLLQTMVYLKKYPLEDNFEAFFNITLRYA